MIRRSIAFLALAAGTAAAQPAQIWHTQLSENIPIAYAGRYYMPSYEGVVNADLNGDGDKNDYVLRVVDPATHTVTTRPFAVLYNKNGSMAAAGDFEAIAIHEAGQGFADLNVDGDYLDDVIVLRRLSTGQASIVPLAVEPETLRFAADGSILEFQSRESDQGADLNGNGNQFDDVTIVLDPATAAWKPVAATYFFGPEYLHPLSGAQALVELTEWTVSIDFNGDGDTNDTVPGLFDFASGTIHPIPVAINPLALILAGEQTFVFQVSESANGGIDRNGDGDAFDSVPAVCERATLAVANLGIAGTALGSRDPGGETHVLVNAPESVNALDLNGDGDQLDTVPWIYEIGTGTSVNLGIACEPKTTAVIGTGYVAFQALENAFSPPIDGNHDGDFWDKVPFVYDLAAQDLVVLPLALAYIPPPAPIALSARGPELMLRGEEYSSQTDFNFDGDTGDVVVFAYDAPTRSLMNLARSLWDVGTSAPGAHDLAFNVKESAEGNQSLNGDADAGDVVAAIFDPETRALFEPGLAMQQFTQCHGIDTLMLVLESGQGVDFTGNGLTTEVEVAILRPLPGGCGGFAAYGAGCPTSAAQVPELEAHGCAIPGGQVRIQVRGGIPGESAFLLLGGQPGSVPIGAGCLLLVTPLLPVVIGPIPLANNGMFGGAAMLPAVLPPNSIPGSIAMQALLTDPALFKHFALSNAVSLAIAP